MPEHAAELISDGFRGAVSLTFDDGTSNQLERAVPPLDDRGLRGTFYLNPRDRVMEEFADDWRRVAAGGHEIGNHTFSHPCPAAITGGRGLENMTLEEIEADIRKAQSRLIQLAPHQRNWSFAYPCYSSYVGRGENRRSYVPVVARHFLAARAGGEYGFANNPSFLDLAALIGTAVERLSALEIIDLVETMTAKRQWVILVFHDIDGSVLPFKSDDYLRILDYLAERQGDILTSTVVDVAEKVASDPALTPETV